MREGKNVHFGRSHHLAVRRALEKANQAGMLDKYLEWVRVQMEYFQKRGDTKALEELEYYRKEADKIKNNNKNSST